MHIYLTKCIWHKVFPFIGLIRKSNSVCQKIYDYSASMLRLFVGWNLYATEIPLLWSGLLMDEFFLLPKYRSHGAAFLMNGISLLPKYHTYGAAF